VSICLQAATSGEIKVGETVVIGHYEQQGLDLPGDMSVLDYVINSGALGDGGMTPRELAAYSASGGVTTVSSGDGGNRFNKRLVYVKSALCM